MKKLLSLGGNYFQMTAVKRAKELGIYVIDVDYLENNPAHKYADEYFNVSTIEKEKVLDVAKKCKIDGIISYASDVSAPTAAYVAENLGLVTNSYDTVHTMTQKDLFKKFLLENGFNTPRMKRIESIVDLLDFYRMIEKDIIIKPLDSSGSKGVYRISCKEDLEKAYKKALKFSRNGKLIAEEFIVRDGYQFDFDIFVNKGEIVSFEVGDQHCDPECNPYVPVGISFPSSINRKMKEELRAEIQRAIKLLEFKQGAINVEAIIDCSGNIYILEMGPRTGGNLIPDAILESTGVNIIDMAIYSALGEWDDSCIIKSKNCCVSSYVFHSKEDGRYVGIKLDSTIEKKVIRMDMLISEGEHVSKYENGSCGLGMALLKFDSVAEMQTYIDHMNEYYDIILEDEE